VFLDNGRDQTVRIKLQLVEKCHFDYQNIAP
jgi:hypothetical protein